MVLAVLEPEKLQGHALSPQLDVDILPVRSGPDDARRHHWREQQLLEAVVVELVGERPGQARRHSTHDVVGHGGDGNAERGTHLAAVSSSPKLNRSTSRILRMATRGLVNCCSSDGLSEEPAEQGLPRASC